MPSFRLKTIQYYATLLEANIFLYKSSIISVAILHSVNTLSVGSGKVSAADLLLITQQPFTS